MRKNKMKNILIMLLTVVMILCSTTAAFGAAEFSDLKSSPYKSYVDKLTGLNVINGYEDGTFRPDNTITRAETCVVISKAMNPGEAKYLKANKNSFSDINNSYGWAEKYVNYASSMGVVNGYEDGSFRPANNVTYNELSAMILKGMGYTTEELFGSWPDNFKNKAIELGIYDEVFKLLKNDEKVNFDYQAMATRGNAVVMICSGLAELQERGKSDIPEKSGNESGYDWISGDAMKLTLNEAVELMQHEGYLAEIALDNYEKDEAIAKGYSDSIKDIKDAISSLKDLESSKSEIEDNQSKVKEAIKQTKQQISNISNVEDPSLIDSEALALQEKALAEQQQLSKTLDASLTQIESALDAMPTKSTLDTNKKMAELQKSFAEENAKKNYQAELNSIEYQTVALYYGVLQAKENLKVCEENLEVQENLLKNVEHKFSVGTVSKMQVTSQQMAVNSAKQKINEAKTALEKAKMNFNILLGFDIRTNIEFTDSLSAEAFPTADISTATEKALTNRLSVVQMDYACEIQELSLELLKKTEGKKSGAYEKQESALALTKLAYENMPKTLETEIRTAYIDMVDKYNTIKQSQETLDIAKEGLRTAEVMYKAGMATLTDVQQAQYSVNQTNQLIMASIASYNIAVYEYEYMMGVGKERIDL